MGGAGVPQIQIQKEKKRFNSTVAQTRDRGSDIL